VKSSPRGGKGGRHSPKGDQRRRCVHVPAPHRVRELYDDLEYKATRAVDHTIGLCPLCGRLYVSLRVIFDPRGWKGGNTGPFGDYSMFVNSDNVSYDILKEYIRRI
jgi:hypothetical protein